MHKAKKILVLGGYGNFGKLICDYLIQRSDVELIITGRSKEKANRYCESLKTGGARCQLSSLALDVRSSHFLHTLKEIQPHIVIHTCGPFQGQDYHVSRACILAGCHFNWPCPKVSTSRVLTTMKIRFLMTDFHGNIFA